MGYQKLTDEDALEGFNVVCPTFTTAGTNPVTGQPYNTVVLSDIALVGDNVKLRTDNLQIFNENGETAAMYQWRANGWYDLDEGEYVNETVIDRAQGVVIDSANGEITIRSTGEVCADAVSVDDCAEGFNVVGNPFPVDLTLAEISLTGDNVKLRTDNLQIFNENGETAAMYQWRANGWYDLDEGEYVNETPFPYGLGVIVDSANGGITVEIESPASLASL